MLIGGRSGIAELQTLQQRSCVAGKVQRILIDLSCLCLIVGVGAYVAHAAIEESCLDIVDQPFFGGEPHDVPEIRLIDLSRTIGVELDPAPDHPDAQLIDEFEVLDGARQQRVLRRGRT
jgi:hypothetical protein